MKIETKIEMLKELKAWTEKYNVCINQHKPKSVIKWGERKLLIVYHKAIQEQIVILEAEIPRCPFCGGELMREHNIRGHYLHCANDDCRYSGPFCSSQEEAEKQNQFVFNMLRSLRENGEQNED